MTLADLHNTTQQLLGQHQQRAERVAALDAEITGLQAEQHLLGHVTATLDTLIETVSRESMGEVERLVTYGLRTVFDDLSLEFKLRIENKRGVQWAEPILIENGIEAPILDAFGGGPAVLASFLLRLLVCRRLKLAPLLLLDEPFPFVSNRYRPALGRLMRQLAEAADMQFVMVTHEIDEDAYLAAAHRAYQIVETPNGNTFKEVRRA